MKEELKRFLPIRIILRPVENGYEGHVENSLPSMGWSSTRVNICWSGTGYDNFVGATHLLDGIKTAENDLWHLLNKGDSKDKDAKVYDPFAEDCPVEVDWNAWLAAERKYDRRNAPFTVKGSKQPVDVIDKAERIRGIDADARAITNLVNAINIKLKGE